MAKRFPVQIGSWKVNKGEHSPDGLLQLLRVVIFELLQECKSPGILLSGGVDSSILAILANEFQRIPCFVIGSAPDHPDILAASRFAKEFNLDLYSYLPSWLTKSKAQLETITPFPGDEGVLIALQFASHFIMDLLATDGIDEQMGGYWWHINRNEQFPETELAYKHFWDELEPNHLTPMFESAKKTGVNLYWVYLHPEVVEYISKIPLCKRVKDGVGKAFWRDVACLAGVPEWVIQRPKRGFVHALS